MLYTQIDPPVSFMRINGHEENRNSRLIQGMHQKFQKWRNQDYRRIINKQLEVK